MRKIDEERCTHYLWKAIVELFFTFPASHRDREPEGRTRNLFCQANQQHHFQRLKKLYKQIYYRCSVYKGEKTLLYLLLWSFCYLS